MLKSIFFPLKRAGWLCPARLLQHLPCLLSFLRVHGPQCPQHTCAPATLPHDLDHGAPSTPVLPWPRLTTQDVAPERPEPAGVWHVLSAQPERSIFPSTRVFSNDIYIYLFIYSFSYCFLLWLIDIEYSSLHYTVVPFYLSVLFIIVDISWSQTPNPSFPPSPPWQPQVYILYVSESISVL